MSGMMVRKDVSSSTVFLHIIHYIPSLNRRYSLLLCRYQYYAGCIVVIYVWYCIVFVCNLLLCFDCLLFEIWCFVLTVCFLITGCGMWMIDRSKFEFHPDWLMIPFRQNPFYKKIFLETLNMLKSNSNILKLVLHSVSQSFFLRRRNSNHDMKQNTNRQFFCQCIHKQHSLCNGILRFDPLTQQPPSLIETDDDGTDDGYGRDGWLSWWSSCRWWGALLCQILPSWFLVEKRRL